MPWRWLTTAAVPSQVAQMLLRAIMHRLQVVMMEIVRTRV
jgi:hypothetical protein